jgi:hypothetical protein
MKPIWTYLAEIKLPEDDGKLAAGAYPRKVVFVLNAEKKNPLPILDALVEQRIPRST